MMKRSMSVNSHGNGTGQWLRRVALLCNVKPLAALGAVLLASAAPAETELQLVKIASVPMKTAREIIFRGNTAFVAQNLEGMTLLDVSNPRRPKIKKRFAPEKIQPMEMKLVGDDLLVVADRFRGLSIWDVSRPDRMTSISELRVPGIATAVDVYEQGDRRFAAVACGGEGMVIVDITDLRAPERIGRFRINTDYSRDVQVVGNAAFIADNFDGGLKAVGVTERPPPLFFKIAMRGFCDALTVHDDLLIASYRNQGFRFFRVNAQPVDEPTTPSLTLVSSVLRSKHNVRKMSVDKSILAVADDLSGIEIYDISNLNLPLLAGEYRYHHDKTMAMSCAFHKGLLYVPSWDAGVIVFEMKRRKPSSP